MLIKITLHDGTSLTENVENYIAEDYAERLNNHDIFAIAVGDTVITKSTIKTISPVVSEDNGAE